MAEETTGLPPKAVAPVDDLDLPITLVANPHSGGGRGLQVLRDVERALDKTSRPFRSELTKSLDHAAELALGAIDAGEVPVAVGGDGLIGAIGGAIAGAPVPLGIIPAGRGNDLTRGLGIPQDPDLSLQVILRGHTREIDVGEANGRRFLGIASVGFDSRANQIANESNFPAGRLIYTYAALRALANWKPVRFSLAIGKETKRFTGYTVALANNGYYGAGMHLAPRADLADGLLELITVTGTSRLRFMANLPKVFSGRHIELPEIECLRVREVEVSASRPFVVYADGDPLTRLPTVFRVLHRALTLFSPDREAEGRS